MAPQEKAKGMPCELSKNVGDSAPHAAAVS
jgi:hypothetical protein